MLGPLLTARTGRGMIVNLSVDTSSVDIMAFAKDIDAFYIDTVIEPWLGLYTDRKRRSRSARIMRLRESLLDAAPPPPGRPHRGELLRRQSRHGVVVRQAGAARYRPRHQHRRSTSRRRREDWGRLPHKLGVKGIHIAERDTQRARKPKPTDEFVNTWSVEGFVSEGHAAGRTRLGHA